MKIKIKYLHFSIFLIFYCCKSDEYKGIKIGANLFENQTIKQNKDLQGIIKELLDNKSDGLKKIIAFDCGGGAGCYDLGYVLSQTLNQIGENNFIKMCETLNYNQRQEINSLLEVGFEYGDNNYDGKMDGTTLSKEFPKLSTKLYEK